jgi:hypothetical protein
MGDNTGCGRCQNKKADLKNEIGFFVAEYLVSTVGIEPPHLRSSAEINLSA